MKRIAVASNENKMVEGFEHCKAFEVYETESGQLEKQWTINNKEAPNPNYLPLYLNSIGVKTVIADSMNSNSKSIFNKKSVEVITSVHGDVEDNVVTYLEGRLTTSSRPVAC